MSPVSGRQQGPAGVHWHHARTSTLAAPLKTETRCAQVPSPPCQPKLDNCVQIPAALTTHRPTSTWRPALFQRPS